MDNVSEFDEPFLRLRRVFQSMYSDYVRWNNLFKAKQRKEKHNDITAV